MPVYEYPIREEIVGKKKRTTIAVRDTEKPGVTVRVVEHVVDSDTEPKIKETYYPNEIVEHRLVNGEESYHLTGGL